MLQQLSAWFSIGAIAIGASIGVSVPINPASAAPAKPPSDPALRMVMVDQAQLSTSQKDAFQRYLKTANLPQTKVGKRCQYYGKPQIWCLILDPAMADRVYQQLKGQPEFNAAIDIKPVRRLRTPEKT